MKTLREYIDQLDEISRRDFLRGAGATAGLAAVGSAGYLSGKVEVYTKNSAYEWGYCWTMIRLIPKEYYDAPVSQAFNLIKDSLIWKQGYHSKVTQELEKMPEYRVGVKDAQEDFANNKTNIENLYRLLNSHYKNLNNNIGYL